MHGLTLRVFPLLLDRPERLGDREQGDLLYCDGEVESEGAALVRDDLDSHTLPLRNGGGQIFHDDEAVLEDLRPILVADLLVFLGNLDLDDDPIGLHLEHRAFDPVGVIKRVIEGLRLLRPRPRDLRGRRGIPGERHKGARLGLVDEPLAADVDPLRVAVLRA